MDKNEVFEEFRKRTAEIADHASEVEEVKFFASLRNGTKFSFVYDADSFDVVKKKEVNSAVNGVADIISALITVSLLSLSALRPGNAFLWLTSILVYAFFICTYIISAVYHLFSVNHRRTARVLLLVRHFFLLLSLSLMTLELTLSAGSSVVIALLGSATAVLSLFLALLSTKGGLMASNIMIALMALMMFITSPGNVYTVLIAVSVMLNAMINAFMFSEKSVLTRTAGTSSLFYLLSEVLLFILSLSIC